MRTMLGAIMLAAIGVAAMAAPPPNADPSLAPWFEGLRSPDTGISCCSISDCRPVPYRIAADHYEVYVNDQWVPVPPKKVLHDTQNPTGHGVVCWTKLSGVMCFVPSSGT